MAALSWFRGFLICHSVVTNQNLKFFIYEGYPHSKKVFLCSVLCGSILSCRPRTNTDMFYAPLITWILSERFLRAGRLRLFPTTLSAWPRSEEKCLVRSGLVQLMDRLCSLSSQTESSSSEKQTKKQKVATMAWAAFQVLANRCVEWEKEEGKQDCFLELIEFFYWCVYLLSICAGWEKERLY